MKCVEAQRKMRAYAEGSLPDKEAEQFLDHVEGCRDCYEELELYLLVQTTVDSQASNALAQPFSMEKQIEATRAAIQRRKLRKMMALFGVCIVGLLAVGLLRLGLIRKMFKFMNRKPKAAVEEMVTETPSESISPLLTEALSESPVMPLTEALSESPVMLLTEAPSEAPATLPAQAQAVNSQSASTQTNEDKDIQGTP